LRPPTSSRHQRARGGLEALRHDLRDVAVDIHRLGGLVVGTGHAPDRLLVTPPAS
jgi:hypothetical protein